MSEPSVDPYVAPKVAPKKGMGVSGCLLRLALSVVVLLVLFVVVWNFFAGETKTPKSSASATSASLTASSGR